MNPWEALEALPGLVAVPAVWQRRMGEHFPAFRAICLDVETWQVASYPCPLKCGCWHRVILRHDFLAASGGPPLTHQLHQSLPAAQASPSPWGEGRGEGEPPKTPPIAALAICECDPPACPDLHLSLADISPLKLNWKKLGRELCRAFGLQSKFANLAPPNTVQIGSWSTAAVPAILTIQVERYRLRSAIAELVALLAAPFILFLPTTDQVDARPQTLLQKCGAALFPLDATVIITPAGTLLPVAQPGELFAKFTPQPKDLDLTVAQRAFALIQQLESETSLPPPTILTVFRLYCIEALSAAESARKCHCSKATVLSRLARIHQQTGVHPNHLRTLSPHIAKLESNLSDPRAKHIHRTNFTDDTPDPDNPES